MDRATQFREAAALANRHRDKTGWRYPDALRRLAVEHCLERRRARCAYSTIAEELGISALTLSRWRAQTEGPPKPGFREVHVEEPASAMSPPWSIPMLSVVTPNGVRVEGLDLAQALELARALA